MDGPGLLLVIDRLGRTIADLEQANAQLVQQVVELTNRLDSREP